MVDREYAPKIYERVDNYADEIYLECRKHFKYNVHRRAKKMAHVVADNLIRVSKWENHPSYNMRKIEILREFVASVKTSLTRIKGIKK